MSNLNKTSADALIKWGAASGNDAAAQAIINAAAYSPYLASQFNAFFSTEGKVMLVNN